MTGQLTSLGSWLLAGAVVLACGTGCTRKMVWTEDIRLPDGRTMQLQREADFGGGSSELGGPHTESTQRIEFTEPDRHTRVVWENGPEGRLGVVALWMDKGQPMMLATPLYVGDLRQFGCPNPPYLAYEHVSGQWRNVPLSSLPEMTVRANATTHPFDARERIAQSHGHLGVAQTSAFVFYLGGTTPVPYVVHLRRSVPQTIAEENCYRPRNLLIDRQ